MQQQERDLISGLFDRLKPFESQPRDGEVEQFIWDRASKQPASAYLLVQTVLVQEQALKAAQERIAELEAKAAATAPQPEAGFLGSAPKIGPWGAPRTSVPQTSAAPVPAPGASMVPSTRSPLQAAVSPQQQQAGGGGSFLRTAMMTAAGVAGGALLFEGIRGLMGNNPFGQSQAAFGGTTDSTPPELLPPDSSAQQQQAFADDQAGADDYDTASLDDGSGGGDDDSWA